MAARKIGAGPRVGSPSVLFEESGEDAAAAQGLRPRALVQVHSAARSKRDCFSARRQAAALGAGSPAGTRPELDLKLLPEITSAFRDA